jgi:hypothetical protein
MGALQSYMGTIVTACVIIGCVLLALLVFRMINGRVRGGMGARMGVTEYHEIDKSRRLVLVRRDDVEHLLLIGGPQDLVIEPRIESPLMASDHHGRTGSMPVAMKPANVQPLQMRPAPRPAVFGGNRPPLRSVEMGARPAEAPLAAFRPERE